MDNDPSLALADILRWAKFLRKRDKYGAKRCREEWFGRERVVLGQPSIAVPLDANAREIAAVQNKGREHLAAICRSCPLKCELAG